MPLQPIKGVWDIPRFSQDACDLKGNTVSNAVSCCMLRATEVSAGSGGECNIPRLSKDAYNLKGKTVTSAVSWPVLSAANFLCRQSTESASSRVSARTRMTSRARLWAMLSVDAY